LGVLSVGDLDYGLRMGYDELNFPQPSVQKSDCFAKHSTLIGYGVKYMINNELVTLSNRCV
jgi:hypothetical protein